MKSIHRCGRLAAQVAVTVALLCQQAPVGAIAETLGASAPDAEVQAAPASADAAAAPQTSAEADSDAKGPDAPAAADTASDASSPDDAAVCSDGDSPARDVWHEF